MADTWLTPGDDQAAVLRACRVPVAEHIDPAVLDDIDLAVGVAVDQVEAAVGPVTDPAPTWATAAGLIIAEHYYRTRLGKMTRGNPTPEQGAGFLVPRQAQEILDAHPVTPLGFA